MYVKHFLSDAGSLTTGPIREVFLRIVKAYYKVVEDVYPVL